MHYNEILVLDSNYHQLTVSVSILVAAIFVIIWLLVC